MSDPIESWRKVAAGFDKRYAAVAPGQLGSPTPCAEWTVRDLVDHVAGVQLRMSRLVGATTEDGADWPAVRDGMTAVLSRPDALEGTSIHPQLGEAPKVQWLTIATNDMLIHTWDLSRAIGADEALSAEEVAACQSFLEQLPHSILRESGRYAGALEVPDDADAQTKLLAFAGRAGCEPVDRSQDLDSEDFTAQFTERAQADAHRPTRPQTSAVRGTTGTVPASLHRRSARDGAVRTPDRAQPAAARSSSAKKAADQGRARMVVRQVLGGRRQIDDRLDQFAANVGQPGIGEP